MRLRTKLLGSLELLFTLVLVGASMLAQLACQQISPFRAADVPLQDLRSPRLDPESEFPESFPLQLAVLWTKPEETGLGLLHTLRQMGIPFFWTHRLDQALKHSQILLYPSVDGKTFTPEQVDRLGRYVEDGGTIFAQNVFAGAVKPLFGFREFSPSRGRHWVSFQTGSDVVFHYLDRPEEQKVRLGSEKISEIFWTNGYSPDSSAKVLASFEDGTAALLSKASGKGRVYLAGVGLDDVTVRNQSNRDFEAQRRYANAFEPGTDVWMLLLRAWYEAYTPNWVRLATIPDGKRSALLLSHDLDSEASVTLTGDYMAMEQRHGSTSTLFMQTKYADDSVGPALLTARNLEFLRKAKSDGFELGSHSVSHALTFNKFPKGTGQEIFRAYRPRIGWASKAYSDGTVFGEVRVSKQLLDGEIPGQRTIFFRAGHLRVPPTLPEALERSGYEFDSSFTAGDVLTNFPYSLPLELGMTEDTRIYEFPVTMEDEEAPGLAGHVDSDLKVIEANADNGAINVLLVHPNDPGNKVPAEEAIIRRLPAGVGTSDLATFAHYWRARDHVRWLIQPSRDPLEWTLKVRSAELVSGLTFEFKRQIAKADGIGSLRVEPHRLILPALPAGQEVVVRIRYAP
jgi:hypothetical protein